MQKKATITEADAILIGGGIAGATLAMILKELNPGMKITIFERMDTFASESSNAWNNAGTGHSAYCELNYTPDSKDKSIDISKALKICSNFEESKQFWAYLVSQNIIKNPNSFINQVPHISLVWGDNNVDFLRRRHSHLAQNELFCGMKYSEDPNTLTQWMPLNMEGRDQTQKLAATYSNRGTDINFGVLAKHIFTHLEQQENTELLLSHEVRTLQKDRSGKWVLSVKDMKTGTKHEARAPFVFIGAGGASQLLLERSDIIESHGYAGFPISGQFLRCKNKEIIQRHHAKVYGKASVGAPPMSVPHLDTRIIDGEKALLFGPYAGFSFKFLKKGSYLDWPRSVTPSNFMPLIHAGLNNIPLTKYLIKEVLQSQQQRIESLKEYFPEAKAEDWELIFAGQRVQVIKKDKKEGGKIEFGTEVVCAADGSLAALLGASPGASIAVTVMIDLISRCFKKEFQSEEWQQKLKMMIPSYGLSLKDDAELTKEVRQNTEITLGLIQ